MSAGHFGKLGFSATDGRVCVAVLLALALAGCGAGEKAKPAPEVRFEARSFEKSIPGCGDHGSHADPCVSFRAGWPELQGGTPDAVVKLNQAILGALGFPSGPAEMESYANGLIERWNKERRGVLYADSTWFERRTIQVLARRAEIWSFQLDRVGQTGTGVPFDERMYLDLNPRTGSNVTLGSLLAKDARPKFEAAAEQGLRRTLRLDSTAALPLKDGRFALPAQYAIVPGGVTLYWADQEIAGMSSGSADAGTQEEVAGPMPPIEVTLPWESIRELLRAEAVAAPDAKSGQKF